MKHATSIALYSYWQSCRRTTGIPAIVVEAAQLAPIVGSLFLVDLTPDDGAPLRYCGNELALRYGRDLTNEPFLALWNRADRDMLEPDLGAMAVDSAGLVAGVMVETVGGGYSAFEMLLLPLRGTSGNAGAIGSMARVGGHQETNRVRARVVSQSLRSIRFLPAPDQRSIAVSPDPSAGRLPIQIPRRQYGHLSVVSGGRRTGNPGPTLTDP